MPFWKTISTDLVRVLAPIAILLVGFVGFFVLGAQTKDPPTGKVAKQAPLVKTIPVQLHRGTIDFEVDGQVVPAREVTLSVEVSGRIVKKDKGARAGRYVKQGTVLFEIDSRDYELESERLKRELGQADVSLQEIDVQISSTEELLKLAEDDLALQIREVKRVTDLAAKRAVSESDVDRAQRGELTARNAMLQQKNEVSLLKTRRSRLEHAKELAQTQLERAQLNVERCQITAPFDGVIITDSVEEADYVRVGDSVLTIEDTSKVEIACNLQMDEIYWVWGQLPRGTTLPEDQATQLRYQLPPTEVTAFYRLGGREYSWAGALDRYDGLGLDEATRTVPCRIVVDKPGNVHVGEKPPEGDVWPLAVDGPRALVRGMYVRLVVEVETQEELLSLPERAIQPGNRVWIVRDREDPDGSGKLRVLKEVPVEVVDAAHDRVLVRSASAGIVAGDVLVVSPLSNPFTDMSVREEAVQ